RSTPVPTVTPTTTATSSADILKWKIYINKIIGFEIKYPDNWEYSEVQAGNPLHLFFYPKHGSDIKSRDPNESLSPVELIVLNDSSSLQCLAEDGKSCLDFQVNGAVAKRYSRKSFYEVVTFKNKKDNLFFELRSPKFDKDLFAPGSYKEYYDIYNLSEKERTEIFDQILSTFKFTQ
ncbi:hypothetical protein M1437_03825, partial [Patescibacteria group bacterium]|nr:hypothetical protein [Patescibacteria group bacterium]